MLITRYDPFKEFEDLREGLQYLNRVFGKLGRTEERMDVDFVPAVNTREGDDAYYVEVDLPGVDKKDISININDNILSISGKREIEEERKEDDFYRVESAYGEFERSFTLPEGVDIEAIEAESKDGVLTIKIPKAQVVDTAPKKIEIK